MAVYIFLTFVISAVIGWIAIPNIIVISKRKRLFDAPNERKVHTQAIPRLGGISFLPGMMFSFCVALGVRYLTGNPLDVAFEESFFIDFLFFTAGLILLFFIGMADDLVGISYKNKFIVQILAALLLTAGDGTIHNLHGLFGVWEIPNVLGVFITVLVTVGLVNAYNLIDGVDGLCSGLGAIALTILSGWFFYNNISVYAMLGAGMLGTLVVFFLYNVRGLRLKIFMGDGGSLMLGYTIAFLGLKFYNFNFNPDFFNTPNVPVLALSVVFIPVFDTVRVFTERILRGKSPFYPDKTHVHHLFLKIGYTHLQSTGLILIVAMLFVIFNFLFQDMNINILFFADIILGLVFLNWLPKQVIRRKESLVQGSGKRHGEQKSYKNRNRNTDL